QEMYADFCRIAELKDPPSETVVRHDERQEEGMLEGAEIMLRVTEQRVPDLPAGIPDVWRTIANVLTRALRDGSSYDLIERGLGVMAVRATDGAQSLERSTETFEQLRELGLTERVGTSEEFLAISSWSALAAPVPMWPLS